MKHISIIVLLIFFANGLAASDALSKKLDYDHVDKHVKEISREMVYQHDLLVSKLTSPFGTEAEKVRAIYVWIVTNIEYDFMAYLHDKYDLQTVNQVMRSGKALCSGYSKVFHKFCTIAGIESVQISGYAKGYGYRAKQKFRKSNHAWNGVKINGQWYLLDATWASDIPADLLSKNRNIDLNTYFLPDPEELVKTHLPEDPSWQLLDQKVSLKEFERNKIYDERDRTFDGFKPDDYDQLSDYDKDILKFKRALKFNPGYNDLYGELSFAYIYRAVSLTDGLWKFDLVELENKADSVEEEFHCYLDSAIQLTDSLRERYLSKMAEKIEIEVSYQRGIFSFEIGTEFFSKGRKQSKSLIEIYERIVGFYTKANSYFEQIPEKSIYFNDAQDYIGMIQDFNNRNRL